MPLSIFKHESHKNMQCDGCHDAKYSGEASDVLMPDLVSCRNCHGGEGASGLLKSTCVTCHDFHMKSQGPMGELIEIIHPNIGSTKMETATLNLRNSEAPPPAKTNQSEQGKQ
ncbi:MAG: cytochrome c3 family protein [Pseudomonadales bacterium]|nr:cytochrome c3 family protein [Pseudomonadales bacterium]